MKALVNQIIMLVYKQKLVDIDYIGIFTI